MFTNTRLRVRYNNHLGDEWEVKNGVRQGAILSPLLFNYFINEVIETINAVNMGCILNFERVNILAYADDVLLLAPSLYSLRLLVDKLVQIFGKLSLTINPLKSQYIVFRPKRTSFTPGELHLLGHSLERVSSIKYLGVFLSEDLHLERDVGRVTSTFLRQFNAMYAQFNFLPSDV